MRITLTALPAALLLISCAATEPEWNDVDADADARIVDLDPAVADGAPTVCVYDVRDLTLSMDELHERSISQFIPEDEGEDASRDDRVLLATLASDIRSAVQPEIWEDETRASLKPAKGMFVIYGPASVHAGVVDLLNKRRGAYVVPAQR